MFLSKGIVRSIVVEHPFNMFREDRGRKHLNEKERGAIIALTSQNVSIKKIAEQLGIGEATVVLWQKRHRETGDVDRKNGSGRPRTTTAEQDRQIVQAVRAKPITTAQEVAGMQDLITFIMGQSNNYIFAN